MSNAKVLTRRVAMNVGERAAWAGVKARYMAMSTWTPRSMRKNGNKNKKK